jgi:dolichol-phosphate mannosyltransferase
VIVAALFDLPLSGLRILIADDNSPDGTGDIAEELVARYGEDRMSVIHRPGKEGLGRAYVDGMTRAVRTGAEFVVQMDGDLSHGPEYLPQMLGDALVDRRRRGYRLTVRSRCQRGSRMGLAQESLVWLR